MASKKFEIVVYEEDGVYIAQCLNVNVASEGDTSVEAISNIREALELYFEDEVEREVPPVSHVKLTELTLRGAW